MTKTALLQIIQFNISTQFLVSKTILFQPIQFIISTQISSIWPIDRTLSNATTPGQNILGNSAFPKAPALLKPHLQIFSCHIKNTLLATQQVSRKWDMSELDNKYGENIKESNFERFESCVYKIFYKS